MQIEVTEEDIQNGIPQSNRCCPVALAMTRAYGVDIHGFVGVSPKTILIAMSHLDRLREVKTPEEVIEFVGNFDRAGKEAVSPFVFTLPDYSNMEEFA